MDLRPDGIIGHSLGEVACGYADGCLSQEEAVLTAYWRGQCIKEANIPPGAMAAVGGCPLCSPIPLLPLASRSLGWGCCPCVPYGHTVPSTLAGGHQHAPLPQAGLKPRGDESPPPTSTQEARALLIKSASVTRCGSLPLAPARALGRQGWAGGTPQGATTLRGWQGRGRGPRWPVGCPGLSSPPVGQQGGHLASRSNAAGAKVPHKGPTPRLSLLHPVIRACPGQCLPLGWGPWLPAARPLRPSLPTGLSWEECKQRCPPGIVPACHNSEDTVTISGPQVGPGRQGLSPSPFPVPRGSSAWGAKHSSSPDTSVLRLRWLHLWSS